jgi:uncharacterized cupin superfamily protein
MIINPAELPEQKTSTYPSVFKAKVEGRIRQRLSVAAGLKNFGVNLVKLQPGAMSALRHWHERQDELIYVLEGEITLITNAGEQLLTPGMAAGFPAGEADGHHLVNRTNAVVMYLEVGDRTRGDRVTYPDDDLHAIDHNGTWLMQHRDGTPYEDPRPSS